MADQWLLDELSNTPKPTPTKKPASKVTPTVKKTTITPPAPAAKTGYNPVSTFKENVSKAQNAVTGGLGVVGDIMSRPLYAFGSGLTGAYEGAKKERTLSGWAKGAATGAYKGLTGENKITPGMYVTDTLFKDKIKNPYAKAGIQLATDIVADPLTPLAGKLATKTVGGISKGVKAASKFQPVQKAVQAAKQNKTIAKAVEGVVPYWRNPEAGKIIEQTKGVIRGRVNKLFTMVDEAQAGLTPAEKIRVGQLLEGGITAQKADAKLVKIANQFRQLGEDIGKEALDIGLLTPESYNNLKGKYMHHMWNTVLDPKYAAQMNITDVPKIDFGPFKKRTGAEGYVKEFQAPTFKGLGTEIKSVEAAKMYKDLGKKFGKTAATSDEMYDLSQKGYKYAEDISKTRGGQVLNKTLLPEEVVDYINRSYKKGEISPVLKAFDKAMNLWKQGKTLWNPAYHVRNFLSNQILTDLQTGKGIPATVVDTMKIIAGKVDKKHLQEAKEIGLIGQKSFGSSVDDLLNGAYKSQSFWSKLAKTPARVQNWMENTAKLNVFSEMRRQGKTVQEALDLAEEAIFSPQRIGAAERSVLGRVIPFYSFTRQAAPFIAKTAIKHPERITKYMKGERAVESLTKPENEEYLPDYMKQMVRTPLKNAKGQQYYFNPQYIYPWGNFLQESKGLPFGLNLNPMLEEFYAQKTNVDPYFGSQIVRPGDPNQLGARVKHAVRTVAPAAYNALTEKVIPAIRGEKDPQGRIRELPVTLAGELGGLKVYPFDVVAGKKSKSVTQYFIIKEAQDEIKRVQKDQSLSIDEKRKRINEILKFRDERLNQNR